MQLIIESLPMLFRGLLVTIRLFSGGLLIGFLLGMILAIARLYGGRFTAGLAKAYSRTMRSIPLLVLLVMLYLLITGVLADLTPFYTAIIAIGMRSAAYQAEIFRTAISSVSSGEAMAGKSLGLSNLQVFRLIILPQALRNAIAPWSNEAAIVVKSSSMAFVIGAPELLRQATYVAARTRQPLLMYSAAGAVYLFIVFVFDRVLEKLDQRFKIP